MKYINSRADLENLRGTADFEDALRGLHGAFTTWSLVDGAWVAQENLSVIERFGYDKAGFLAEVAPFDFPAPVAPDLPVEPEPVPYYPSTPSIVAAAYNIGVENGSVTGISAGAKISAGFSLDTGLYMLFFDDEQPDTNFFTRVWDNDAKLRCVDKDEYSITVAATDANGDPIDPETFCVEIIRVL